MKTVLNVVTVPLKDLSSSKRIIFVTNIFIAGNKMDIQMAVKSVDAASVDYVTPRTGLNYLCFEHPLL